MRQSVGAGCGATDRSQCVRHHSLHAEEHPGEPNRPLFVQLRAPCPSYKCAVIKRILLHGRIVRGFPFGNVTSCSC